MNTNTPNNKTVPVLTRLDNLEKVAENLYQTLDASFGQFRNHIATAMEAIEGIVAALKEADPGFGDKVDSAVKAKRTERLQKKADKEKQEIETLLVSNVIRVAETLAENSIVVGRLFSPDGSVVNVGREQLEFAQLSPEAQTALKGQGVGAIFEKDGHKLEILELYELVPPEAKAVPTETAAPAPEVTAPAETVNPPVSQ